MAIQLPARSTLAAGLAGLAAWGISLGLASLGVVIPAETLTPIVLTIAMAVAHFVPDTLKDHAKALDVNVKDLAAILPVLETTFPTGVNGTTDKPVVSLASENTNINKG